MFVYTAVTTRTGFANKAPRDDRYNYLDPLDELGPWISRIKEVAKQTKESYVITNNHFLGKAVVNALEIKSILNGEKVPRHRSRCFKRYPALEETAFPDTTQDQTQEPTSFS